jgi:hypothetical protein
MNSSTPNSGIPSAIVHKLQLVRKRKVWLHVASAVVTALAVLLAAMGVAMLIDWLATLYDSRWRVVLTAMAISAAVATAVGWLIVARRRLLALNEIAGDVDRQIPQLEERWTTITRLGEDATNSNVVHPAMLRRVSKEAVSFEPHVEPDQVVPVSILMRSMIGLTAVTAVLAIAVVMNSHQTWVLVKRFWQPSSLISATELVNLPGDVVIGRGEPLELNAALDGTPVERATLFLQPENDEPRTVSMVAHGTDPIEFSHRLRAVEQPFEYRFRAGDGQSEWYSVSVAERPEIEKLLLTVTPPAYTRKETKTFERLPQRVATIQKSKLELAIRPKAPVQTVVLQLGGDKQVALTAEGDGWYHWETTLDEGFDFTTVLTESHGLQNRRPPKCSVSVYPDRPPAVKVLTPDDQMAVRPGETIPITFSASDDVGIESAELLVYDESAAGSKTEPIATIPIELGDQEGAKLIRQSVDLELAKFAAEDGAEISYEIRVREDRGASQSSMANQNAGNSATQSSPQNSSAATQQTASSQSGRQSQRETSPRDAQAETKMAQSQPQSPAERSAAKSGLTTTREPEKSESALNQAVAKSAPPAEARPSQGSDIEKTSTPPANSIAANLTPPNGAAPSDANSSQKSQPSKSQGAQSQASPNNANPKSSSSAQSQTAQNEPAQNQTSPSNESSSPISSSQNNTTKPKASSSAQNDNQMAQKSAEKPGDPATPREATTGRKGLSTDPVATKQQQPESNAMAESKSDPAAAKNESAKSANSSPTANAQSKPSGSKPAESKQAQSKQSPKKGSQQANPKSSAPSSSQTASSSQSNSSSESQPSNDNMPKRMLDVPEPSSNTSKRMRLKIDELAGSFSGQQRAKLEMAVGPELEALDKALAKGQRTARGVLDQLEADAEWRGTHDRDVSGAERATVEAQDVIGKLQQRSKDTPYAFVGLQVADIGLAHVDPARSDFWKALQSDGGDRAASVRDGWQHLGRARELVAELRGQYERAKREFQLAESVEKFKTMYQVFIENTQALLPTQAQDPDRYNREGVEFKLDEEYLARLKEVLEMRRDLQAELARILADDPRLLRRFMDATRNRTNNLREELADLSAEQEDLNREVRAWSLVEEADRPRMGRLLMLRQVQDATKISEAAGDLQSSSQAWMPLGQESKDPDVVAATKMVQEVAAAAGELGNSAQKFVAESQRVKAAAQADRAEPPIDKLRTEQAATGAVPSDGTTADAAQQAAQPAEPSLDPLLADGQRLYDQLSALDVSLRQLAAHEDGGEAATFATNRLVDTRRLIADTSAWVRQMRAHNSGNYSGAAEVDQYRLAMKTDSFATKLSALEQSLAGGLQRQDSTLPEAIAQKSRELMATLDRDAAPNQLAAVYALHSNQMPRATERQKSAGAALAKAEQQYDELMRLAIAEMDKLPVQDPIASLLQDPTLDEILAELERELPIQELLGIPLRPSNLRIIGDWLRPNMNPNGSGVGAQMAANQMRQDQQRMRRRLDEAYKRAVVRALKEEKKLTKVEIPKTSMSDWNKLVSELGDDIRQGRDKMPPEQYRRAIEQYFTEISRAVADREKQAP